MTYRLDRANAKLMGVCSGFAEMTGFDVTLVRVAFLLLTVFAFGPLAVLLYGLIGWLAP